MGVASRGAASARVTVASQRTGVETGRVAMPTGFSTLVIALLWPTTSGRRRPSRLGSGQAGSGQTVASGSRLPHGGRGQAALAALESRPGAVLFTFAVDFSR